MSQQKTFSTGFQNTDWVFSKTLKLDSISYWSPVEYRVDEDGTILNGGIRLRWTNFDNPWGIKKVQQEGPTCFRAVMSMLTGIDQFTLPRITVQVEQGWPSEKSITISEAPVVIPSNYTIDQPPNVSWSKMRRAYRKLGFNLRYHTKRPNIPSARLLELGRHIAVHLPDDTYIDPDTDNLKLILSWGMQLGDRKPVDIWITATPIVSLFERVKRLFRA